MDKNYQLLGADAVRDKKGQLLCTKNKKTSATKHEFRISKMSYFPKRKVARYS